MVPWYPELLGYMDVYDVYIYIYIYWLVVSTILKNMSQWEGLHPMINPIYEMENKIHVPNHQPIYIYICMYVCIYVLYTHGKVVFPTIMGINGKQKVDQWGMTVSKSIPWHSSRLASYVYSRW